MPRYRGTYHTGIRLARKATYRLARHKLGFYHVPYQGEFQGGFIMWNYQPADTTIYGIAGRELGVGTHYIWYRVDGFN